VHAGVQDCVSEGVPVHPVGVELVTVRVWVPVLLHSPKIEYLYVQAFGVGVQVLLRSAVAGSPVQLDGLRADTVRVWVPLEQVAGVQSVKLNEVDVHAGAVVQL